MCARVLVQVSTGQCVCKDIVLATHCPEALGTLPFYRRADPIPRFQARKCSLASGPQRPYGSGCGVREWGWEWGLQAQLYLSLAEQTWGGYYALSVSLPSSVKQSSNRTCWEISCEDETSNTVKCSVQCPAQSGHSCVCTSLSPHSVLSCVCS